MKRAHYNPFYNESAELSISGYGYERHPAGTVKNLDLKYRYVIQYVVRGSGYYECHKQKFALNMGDVFFVFPKEPTTYYGTDDLEVCWLCFSGLYSKKLVTSFNVSPISPIIKSVDPRFVKTITECIEYTESNNEYLSEMMLFSYFFAALSSLKPTYKSDITRSQRHVTTAISFMEDNYGSGIGVSDITAHLHIDRTVLYKEFKAHTGESPLDFLTKLRITKAKYLIRDNMSLKEVAFTVGFKNIYYFSTTFKRVEGITPGQYNKTLVSK